MQDKVQPQRFELKYLISETKARSLRDFVRSYLEIDEYGEFMPNLSYPVHSLYLDSDDLMFFHDTINGNRNRYKLRLRYYDDTPDAPVFFEIKRRRNNTIFKQRGAIRGEVRRQAVDWILSGHFPQPDQLMSQEPKCLVAIQRFCYLMQCARAAPKAHVSYLREAWISRRDNSVRVTMDRQIQCAPESRAALSAKIPSPQVAPFVFDNQIVLELKFTDRYPLWFQDLVESFNLVQSGASKYVDGIELLGTERFTTRYIPVSPAHRSRPVNGKRRELPEELHGGTFVAKEADPWTG